MKLYSINKTLTILSLLTMGFCFPSCSQRKECDSEYVQALGSINSFLGSWQTRNTKTGMQSLCDELRKQKSEEEWGDIICGSSNPHHAAYEVRSWEIIGINKYRFYVVLYEHYTGENAKYYPERRQDFIDTNKNKSNYYQIVRLPASLR